MKREFKVVQKITKFENQWLRVQEYHIRRGTKDGIYGVVERSDSVAGIIHDLSNGSILFVRQFRFPTQEYQWELPMGGMDPGETTLESAKREFAEETGADLDLVEMGCFYPAPGLTPQQVTVFSGGVLPGEAAKIVASQVEVDEIVDRRFFDIEEIKRMIHQDQINGFTLSALAKYVFL